MVTADSSGSHLCAHRCHLLEQTADFALAFLPVLGGGVQGTNLSDDTLQNADDGLCGGLHQRILPRVNPDGEIGRVVHIAEVVAQLVHQRGFTTSPLALKGNGDGGVGQSDVFDECVLIDLPASCPIP